MQELQLRPYHEEGGALFRSEAGWSVPVGYGSLDAEVRAVRTRAGLIDLSDHSKIEVTGSERVPFLDGLVTADMKVLKPGTSAYTLLLNEKSRVLGDFRVYALPDSLVLDIEAAQKESVLRLLEHARVSDDVEFRDLGVSGHLEVLGPASADFVTNASGAEVRGMPLESFVPFSANKDDTGYVARLQTIGEQGYVLWSPASSLVEIWASLTRRGIPPIGRDAYDVLRIEAGVPRIGIDMGEDTLALEVAPMSAISFTKGCYTGQEVVARGTYIGQMNRSLLGLEIEGDQPPARGARVRKGDREIGHVTSAVWSPTLGRAIALSLLRVREATPDSSFAIEGQGWDLRAKLHPLPFVRAAS